MSTASAAPPRFVKSGEVAVPFAGEGSGTADMTWGQREIWASIELAGRSIGLGGAMRLPPGGTLEDCAAVLGFSIGRHQALRTRFECDASGRPVRQSLVDSGQIALDIFDATDDDDPDEYAAALRWHYEGINFDYANEWPIRMGAVRHRGEVTHAVVMYSHLIIDGYGVDALSRDVLSHLDRVTGAVNAPVAGTQPLEQARWQSSVDGQRQSDTALRYWDKQLRLIPAQRFHAPGSLTARQPRYWQAALNSPAMHLALNEIADRTRIETSPVLLAALAVSLARVTGRNPSAIRSVVSNRFRAGFAETASVVNQSGLCVINVADATFDEVVLRAWRASLSAGKNAYYDPVGLAALIARVGRERGEELDMSCFFNDARRRRPGEETDPLRPEQLHEALARSQFRFTYQQDQPTEHLFMHINDTPDTVDFSIAVDTAVITPDELEACVRGIEAVLIEAAFDSDARTGVRGEPVRP